MANEKLKTEMKGKSGRSLPREDAKRSSKKRRRTTDKKKVASSEWDNVT